MHDLFAHTRVVFGASPNTFSRLLRLLDTKKFPRPFPVGEAPTGAAEGGCAPQAKPIRCLAARWTDACKRREGANRPTP